MIFSLCSVNVKIRLKCASFRLAMKEEATCVDLSLHYNILVTGAERANVGIWDLQTGKRNAELVGHSQGLTGVRILPETSIGKFLLSAPLIVTSSYDGTLRLWSGKHHVCLAFLKGHRDLIRSLECTTTRYISLYHTKNDS